MTLSDISQQRVWILTQKLWDNSNNLDKMLSNMQILCNIYKKDFDEDDENKNMKKKTIDLLKKIKSFRKHETFRKQKVIHSLKIEIDDLISDMIYTVDPKNMVDFNIFEPNR